MSKTTRCTRCGNDRPDDGPDSTAVCPHCGATADDSITPARDANTLLVVSTDVAPPAPASSDATLLDLTHATATQSDVDHSTWDESNADTRHIGTSVMAAEAAIDSLRNSGTLRHIIGAEIARGGMGVILASSDQHLRREVAMKILLPGAAKDPDRLQRFIEEAQVTGQLDHPNVVPVHDLGILPDGRLYFTMKLVRGRSLSDVVRKLRSGDADTAHRFALAHRLIIVRQICLAVAFAHSRGVVHRDLKPDNVMIGDYGEVLVMDWGLARVGDHPDRTATRLVITDRAIAEEGSGVARTLDGTVAGTPAYMAPEQAAGKVNEIDARSDIWSLGAILFELLAWRPPFEGHTWSILQAVQTAEPQWPGERADDPAYPRELLAIVRKAMQRDKRDRYETVRDLINDIERFQEGRTVGAASYTTGQMIAKWVHRHRAAVIPSAIGLTLLLVLGVSFLINTIAQRNEVQRHAEALAIERDKAREQTTLAMNALGQANVNLAEALCARAQQAIDQHDTLAATLLLTRARELAPGSLRVQALTLARPRAVVTFGRRVQAFDVRVAACAFRPDGSLIAATQAGQLAPAVDGTHDTACSVCFSPDAAWLYTVEPTSGVLQQIDTRTGLLEQQWSMHGEHEFTRVLAVSPDGTRIAVSSLEGVHIATPGKTELRAHYTVIGGYSQLALHPDEEHTVVGMRFGLAMLQSGAGAAPWLRTPNEDEVGQIAWHPDGDHIAFASGDTRLHLAYRRLSDSTRTVDLGATINRLAWSPDGKMLAVACGDGTLRLWCARTWRELAMLAGHGNSAEALAFSADGLQLAVGGSDGTVTVWHVHPPPDAPMHDDPYGRALQFSPDGRHVMISSSGLWAMPLPVFDVATGEEAATLSSGRINTHAAFVEQGIAQASQSAGMLLLPGRESTPVDAGTAIQRLAVSGSGRFVALGCEPPLRVDARDGTTTPLIASDGDALYDPELALDDSGQSAAVATVAALNVGAPGADQLSWCDHSVEDARDMAFDHAGQRIAWMNVDRLAVMDARSGNELWHRDAFNTDGAVAITRDDRLLVAGSTTTSGNLGGARLLAVHDLRDGTLLARVPAPPQQFAKQLALSPDGLTLACTFESAMLLLFGGTLPDSVAAAERESGLRLSGPGGLDVLPATASGPLDAAGSAPTAAAHDPALAALWPAWWTAHRYVMTRSDDEIHPFGYVRALRSINARLAWCDHLAQQAADNDRLVELLDEERIALEELRGMMPVAEDEWFADGFAPLREWLAKWPAHRRAALVADIVRQD